jgi:hypothetical protein
VRLDHYLPRRSQIGMSDVAAGVSAMGQKLPHAPQHLPRLIWRLSINCRPVILLVVGVLRLWIVAADCGLVRLCWGCVPPMHARFANLGVSSQMRSVPCQRLSNLLSGPSPLRIPPMVSLRRSVGGRHRMLYVQPFAHRHPRRSLRLLMFIRPRILHLREYHSRRIFRYSVRE